MSKQNIKTKEKFNVKTVFTFQKKEGTKTAFFMKDISGLRDNAFKKKLNSKGTVYVTNKTENIKAIPKPIYRVTGKGHITSLFKHSSYQDSEFCIYIGDIGKDRPYDILLFYTSNNFENSFILYHIESSEIIKDTLESYIIELFKKGYFDKQLLRLDKQYYFEFMYQ
jgi:hypothetical protein